MKKSMALRVLSGLVALNVLLQPVMAGVSGLTSANQLQEGLVKSGVFSNANAPEAESLASVWGHYLSTFSDRADSLRAGLDYETRLTAALRDQLVVWEKLRAELRPEGDAVSLAESVEKLDRLLRTALDRRQATISELQGHVESITAAAVQLTQQKSAAASVFVAAFEFDMAARLLDSESELTDRVWNALVLGQAGLLDSVNASETQLTAAVTISPALEVLREAEPKVLEQWNDARIALANATTPSNQQIDWTRESALLTASRRLANRATESLAGKSDANSKAHAAMVQRFATIVDHRMEQLAALATEPVDGIRESSFLQVADAATLKGEWAEHAGRHETIGRSLVEGLADADKIFQDHYKVAERMLNAARQVIGTVARAEEPGQSEAFATLKQSLMEADPNLARYEQALQKLDHLRLSLLKQAAQDGKQPFAQADLRSREEASAYSSLGQLYELAHVLLLEMRLETGSVQALGAATQELGIDTQAAGLRESAEAFDFYLPRWSSQNETQQKGLEELRKLSIQVAGDYVNGVTAFSSILKKASDLNQGSFSKVLGAMQAWTQRGADTVNGLTTPMLEALNGNTPQITAPVLSWTGSMSLQGVLKRTIERGHYFKSVGAADLATLNDSTANVDSAGGASSLALVDLAIAIDYPVRVFVAPDGMTIIVGRDGPGAIIKGIGNPEQYRLDPSAPQSSLIPDFSTQGTVVGWDLWGDFQNFANDAGQVIDSKITAAATVTKQAVQGVQKFGAQVVDSVGPVVDATSKFAVEAGGFLWDSAVTMGEDIWNDPLKLVEYGVYAVAITGAVALTVGTGGAALPLLLATAKYVGTQVAFDYGKAMVKTAAKRGYIDDTTSAAIILGVDVVHAVVDIKKLVKNLGNAPKTISGVNSILRGVTPRWTVGLAKNLRDLAHAGKISWKVARSLQYAGTAYKSAKAIKTFLKIGVDTLDLLDALEQKINKQVTSVGHTPLKSPNPLDFKPLVTPPPLNIKPLKW